ncbi:MAG TPA: type VI immunity family protein, partial [Archangium sp.]|nr:type VI immunity family protein [Archangium sp.]
IAQAVIHSLEAYVRAVGPQALGWYVDQEGDWRELDAAGRAHIWSELHERRGLVVELTDSPSDASQYAFQYYGKPLDTASSHGPDAVCAVSFWLPPEYLEKHGAAQLRALALELAAPLPFNSGHASLAFSAELQLLGVSAGLRSWCFRYPGMDMPDLGSLSMRLGTRVRGAYWLTFLGQPVLGELDGAAGLRARLSAPDISIQELAGERAVVTLGDWPEAGDTEQGQDLPLHRELARVLEPWLHQRRIPWNGFTLEDMRRWERRFLD